MSSSTTRAYLAIGHFLFLGLFILSIIHFRERVVHVDSALQIFKWIQTSDVEVEAYRFSAIFPQLVVRFVKATGAELKVLMLVASVMHVLVPWLIYASIAYVFKSPWIAAATALAAVLCSRLTFYGIVLEANYLLSYPFLLAAILESSRQAEWRLWRYLAAYLSLALVLMVHPVGFLIAIYVLVFFWITQPKLKRRIIGLAVLAILWGLFSRMLLPPSSYESDLYRATTEGFLAASDITKWPSLDFLIGHTWRYTTHYLLTWISFVLTLVLIAKRKAWLLFALVTIGTGGYIMLIVVTYHAGETAIMMEKNFLPLATLIALPLLNEITLRSVFWWRWSILPFVFVLFIQFRGISFASRQHQERYLKIERLVLEAKGISKGIVSLPKLDVLDLGVVWALPFETLLISALNGPENNVTLVSENTRVTLPEEDIYFWPWEASFPPNDLNQRFFNLPEGAYERLPEFD